MAAARSMAKHSVLLFAGDGIGPEIIAASCKIIDATGVAINWIPMDMGYEAKQRTGVSVGEEHLQAFEKHKIIFKGPLTIPPQESNEYIELRGRKFTSGNQVFRKLFGLYANVRPAHSFPFVKSRYENVDLVVVRENTEDLYTGEERWVDSDTVECIKRITRSASQKVAAFAFDYARKYGRKHVTAVHKANVCKQSDGLFLKEFYREAEKHKDISLVVDDSLADSILTKLVLNPSQYDVLVCPNLFGDLISDLAGGLIGSLGLCPSANIGDNGYALFEPAHGSAPDIAGKGIANPCSSLLSGVMMLEHLGESAAARTITAAVQQAFADKVAPRDLGGSASTQEWTDYVVALIKKSVPAS